jgi:hypothetical protein
LILLKRSSLWTTYKPGCHPHQPGGEGNGRVAVLHCPQCFERTIEHTSFTLASF